ncbi:MAG: DUF3326 domain-containing protein [Planctomycetes bacterium]|nr:DUF3326 domain-containing protein [Planctomycetota bacterium]
MIITERELYIKTPGSNENLLAYFAEQVKKCLAPNEVPVRFVVSSTNKKEYLCELGVLENSENDSRLDVPSIFSCRTRSYENTEQFNIALIIPTGIGCELGGHSGDGGAVARLFASMCDQLITHPNVVNAADINELPANGLYVEGSVLTRLFMGTATLQKVRANRVMLVVDRHEDPMFHELAVNSASAARAAMGMDIPLVVIMDKPILMRAQFSISGRAAGRIEHFQNLHKVLSEHEGEYDAVALSTLICIPSHFHADYFKEEKGFSVNPWGGVEAMLTHTISSLFNVQSAHSPMMTSQEVMNLNVGIVDPRKSAEAVSTTYLHCVLKGLHRAPRILDGIHSGSGLTSINDISCLVIPDGCIGLPVLAAIENEIPVIAVKDHSSNMKNELSALPFKENKLFFANNYLEAAGIAASLKAGIALDSLKRPLAQTKISIQSRQFGKNDTEDPVAMSEKNV